VNWTVTSSPLYAERVAALDVLWQRWADVGDGLTESDWARPTRCTGWDVRAVYGHHSMLPLLLSTGTPPAMGEDVTPLTAAQVLVTFNQPDGVAHTKREDVAASAVQLAGVGTGELVNRFRIQGAAAIAALHAVDADVVVPWVTPQTPVAVHELIRIVLMEATVHLLDVYDGVGRACDVDQRILGHTVELLAEMAPAVEFIEAATGRRQQSPLPVLR